MALQRITSGGDFFKAADHLGSYVILFSPKQFEANAANGKFPPKDAVYADIQVFPNEEALVQGKPVTLSNAPINSGPMVRDLKPAIGNQVAGVLGQVPTDKGNPAWIINNPSDKIIGQVEAFLAQEEKRVTDALTSDDAPAWAK